MLESSGVAAQLVASQEGLSFMCEWEVKLEVNSMVSLPVQLTRMLH
jgi:hypothetical protein